MPSVITSSSTGSRVLHKANHRQQQEQQEGQQLPSSNSGASTPNHIPEDSSSSRPASLHLQHSNGSSGKMRRFPSLLGSKSRDGSDGSNSNSKHRSSQSVSVPASSSSGSRRNTSMSGAANAGAANAANTAGHSRSVSLASAPSGLPRPSTTGIPSSASQPVMPKPASSVANVNTNGEATPSSPPPPPSGIPQAKRVAPPSTASGAAAAASTPSRIPSLAGASTTSPVGRTTPSNAGTTTAGQFAAVLPAVNGHNKTTSEASAAGYRTASQYSSSPNASMQGSGAGHDVVPVEAETPTKGATSGAGFTASRSPSGAIAGPSSGIPRLRNISETSGGSAAAVVGNRSGTATPPNAGAEAAALPPVNMYTRSRDASGVSTSTPGSSISEGGGSRVSTTRQPAPSVAAPAVATQPTAAADSTVPAMWRTSSYEGSTKAYLANSASMSRSASSSSQAASTSEAHRKNGYMGISGLQALEAKYLDTATSQGARNNRPTALTADQPVQQQNIPAIQHRIRLLRKLVDLRGERVLQGLDIEKVIWLEGTNLHLTSDQELAMARNGSIITNTTASPMLPGSPAGVSSIGHGDATTNGAAAPSGGVPPIPNSPSRAKKQGLFNRMAASLSGSGSGHARKASTGSVHSDTKRNQAASGSSAAGAGGGSLARRVELSQAEKAKSQGPIFGVKIADAPPLAYAVSIIGGQRHQLPILVFSLVEAIFRRGIDTSGIFRMNGDANAISRLVDLYNTYPSYGDDVNLENETIFTLCDLLKRYLKDMPEAVLPTALWNLFIASCLYETGGDPEKEHVRKLAAAQIIFRLLPRKNMSLLIYLTAFLFQLPLHASNRLTVDSIAVIFGPAILAPRSGLGSSTPVSSQDSNTKRSQEGLKWLLDNWDDSLSQDLLDEEYNPLASPELTGAAWSTDQGDIEAESREPSPEQPKMQSLPANTAILQQAQSPAFSMAATPMMHSLTQQTTQTDFTAATQSPVPEGWGEAISPSEDAANLQRQMMSSKPRKSSHDIDPAFPSPSRSEFGILPNPNNRLSTVESLQAEPRDAPVESTTAPATVERASSPEKPRSLKSTKSTRSLRETGSASTPAVTAALPGALPLPTSPTLESRSSYTAMPDGVTQTAAEPDHTRDIGSETASTAVTRSDSTTNTPSGQDTQSSRTAAPLHSRKESMKSEEGRSNSTFGGIRSSSYAGRPYSYARSDAAFSDGGYVPEEITADPNAARLFGSLGELFMNEKRRAAEYQAQLHQLEQRHNEREEHIANLQRDLEERDGHAKQAMEELAALKSSSAQHQDQLREGERFRDELQSQHRDLQSKHEDLRTSHQALQDTHNGLQESVQRLEQQLQQEIAERKSQLEAGEEARAQERRALVAEINALREQVDTHARERDLARKQLGQIRSLLDPAL